MTALRLKKLLGELPGVIINVTVEGNLTIVGKGDMDNAGNSRRAKQTRGDHPPATGRNPGTNSSSVETARGAYAAHSPGREEVPGPKGAHEL